MEQTSFLECIPLEFEGKSGMVEETEVSSRKMQYNLRKMWGFQFPRKRWPGYEVTQQVGVFVVHLAWLAI